MSTKETWNKVYDNLTDFNPLDLAFYKRLTNIITQSIGDSKSILEVGSGSGFLTSFFQKRNMFSVGLDRSINPIKIARERYQVKNLILGDMFYLPFKSLSFDVVWNEGVLEHFKYPKNLAACKEMTRVSKNLVIIAVPNRYTIWPLRKTILKYLNKWPYGYEESYSKNRLKSLMENTGLEVLMIEGVRILPPIKERKKTSDILSLAMLTLPLNKSTIEKMAKNSITFEEKHQALTRMFGYEIIAIAKKKL